MIEKAAIASTMIALGKGARAAGRELARSSGDQRNTALTGAADHLLDNVDEILAANRADVAAAEDKGLSTAMIDRLHLDAVRVKGIADGLRAIADLPDPINRVESEWTRPNGLNIQRVRVPLGVIGIIYESRPNVTADAAGLCIKSGNAVILRGGSESYASSQALMRSLLHGLHVAELPATSVQMVPTRDRDAVGFLLSSMSEYVDVIVPRGGKNLIARVQEDARVPVIGHLEGLCHVYIHAAADFEKAVAITTNAKLRRTGICGAAETLLVDRSIAADALPPICAALIEAGCELRGDDNARSVVEGMIPASDEDWETEYLDAILAIRVVDGIDAAISHIERHGSGHTECIVTEDQSAADRFLERVDSAILLHNASTQFADGGEFGMGAEIGIATGRIHARGPVGAMQLTSYKYVVRGTGQVRP